MQKSKRGEALFDKLSREGGEISDFLRQGSRWSRRRADHEQDPRPCESGLRLVASRDRFEDGETWICLEGQCLRVRLAARGGAILLFLGVVLLASCFVVGRSSGRQAGLRIGFEQGQASVEAAPPSEIELARAMPAVSGLVEDLLPGAPAHSQPAVISAPSASGPRGVGQQWIRGHTYVVAQEFRAGHKVDAQAAQDYLAVKGIPTAVVRFPSGSLQLITTQGFDRGKASQRKLADKLLAKVHGVGKKYYASGGRYRLQGYFRKLTAQSW